MAAPAAAPASVRRGSSVGRFTRAVLLYGLGGSFIAPGMALIGTQPATGLGFLGAAALVTPGIRWLAYRVTSVAIPRALRVLLVLTLPVLPWIVQTVQVTSAEQRAEREKLAVELAAQKPALQKRLEALIDAKAYQVAVTEAKRFDLVHDADITALGEQAQRLLDAQLAEQAATAKRAEQAALAKRAEQARCDADDACFSKPYEAEARQQCKPVIEAYARYDHEWTDGFGGPSTFFSAYVDRNAGTIRFTGNQLKLQNGFGAWRRYRYECLFDYRKNRVVTAEVNG